MQNSKHLASLAVFRELYNNQTDVYGVICELLDEIIDSNGKHEFNLTEITILFNESFEFSIPEAVIATSLGRIKHISKISNYYVVDNSLRKERTDIKSLQNKTIENNDIILENLFNFIAKEKDSMFSDTEKEKITQSFCSFLMDHSNGEEYSEYISGYIIQEQGDEKFRENLSRIREGVILYSGLKYNTNLNEVGSWKNELTIFLDTEILFHFAGFNGILFKAIFDEFFKYVTEINQKGKTRLIKLKYLPEVKAKIERFFSKAEHIIKGHEKPNPKRTAMCSVIEGAKTVSDILEKKSDFFLFLQKNLIKEEEFEEYFEERNHQYNILDQNTIEQTTNDLNFDTTEYLRILNYVSILRNESNSNNFYNISYILLTGNSRTTQLAWQNAIKPAGTVPLATNLYWLTNKFWFKLNKGFGEGSFPTSLKIITKAQTTLSAILNESIGEKFDELKKQSASGTLSKDQVKARIVDLRTQVRNPENIESDEISSILNSITEDSLNVFIREQELTKRKAQKSSLENERLKAELEQTEKEKTNEEKARVTVENELQESSVSYRLSLVKEKEKLVNSLKKHKEPIDTIIDKSYLNFKITIGISFVLYYLITFFLIHKYSWNTLEQWTFIINGSIPIIFSFLYLLFNDKNINPLEYLIEKKKRIRKEKYKQFNVEIENLHQLQADILQLKKEI